jgi:hypothetical protein
MPHNYTDLFSRHEAMMLEDADKAITECGLWDWLRDYNPEEGKGFMFSNHPNLDRINNAMKYGGHSGTSYGWTMRNMEYIAKHGWTLFEFKLRQENMRKVLQNVNTDNHSPLDIAEASRGVPGFEGEYQRMKDFFDGKMRDACPCHKEKGLPGWCGVAGGGVPGCCH